MYSTSHARVFNPTVSVLATYTATYNHFVIESGIFNSSSRKVNFGFELTNKFYLGGNFFFKTGLRYNQYQTIVNGLNQISVLMDYPYPFSWERRFESAAVPLLAGRDFMAGGRRGNYYLGASIGILMSSYLRTDGSTALKKDPDNTDLILGQTVDTGKHLPNYFFPTLDFGISYHPLNNIPAFSLGLQCSIQLNQTKPYYHQGIIANYSRGETYSYRISNHQNFINYSLLLSYTFGRVREVKTKGSALDCPR